MSEIIPNNRAKIRLSWANRPTEGSRYRRGNPLKPDATILKSNAELVYMEIKPPRVERHGSLYLEDHWKLACLCKDAIDDHLRQDRDLLRMGALQVFGHEIALYTLYHRSGVYHWNQVAIATLPRDRKDKGKVEGCLELMLTLKAFLEETDTEAYMRTPSPRPGVKIQPTHLTPTKRPMFIIPKQILDSLRRSSFDNEECLTFIPTNKSLYVFAIESFKSKGSKVHCHR
ncbi:hypothetical protein B0O80DRAFT_99612 [Mortierella sp. GBAus27b]|nr:hypothetical protein B0O80DRAFT_99612 [Mortierella sp. GBAus27b]